MKFSESLKKNRDFQYVYRNGRSFANKYFIMYVLENNQDRNYIGISVSKKVAIVSLDITCAELSAKFTDYMKICLIVV